MRVMVTGGTGFVGSHIVRQLLHAGHEPVMLVRNAEKAQVIYQQIAVKVPTLVTGDVIDQASVRRALVNCDAVVHCAAGTPINAGDSSELFTTNVQGTRNVADAAMDAGVGRIIYLSSITAIFNSDASQVTAEAPLTPSSMAYGRSKIEAERYLRELQAQSAPISIVYPGGVLGPDDPGLSDAFKALIHRFNEGFRITEGGMQHVDVRDLATFVVALLRDTTNCGRYLLPGPFRTWAELAELLACVSGYPLQKIQARGWVFRALGRYYDLKRWFTDVDSPISAETMRYSTLWPHVATSAKHADLGLHYRSPEQTFSDSLRWLGEQGYLEQAKLPKLFDSSQTTQGVVSDRHFSKDDE
jgi:dihydroflavonol-4-reductase